jgi:PAS domain S-box-containing protein
MTSIELLIAKVERLGRVPRPFDQYFPLQGPQPCLRAVVLAPASFLISAADLGAAGFSEWAVWFAAVLAGVGVAVLSAAWGIRRGRRQGRETEKAAAIEARVLDASARDRTRKDLERIVAERTAELSASEARLREAQRVGRMGSWQLDFRTQHLSWSEEIFRIFEIDSTRFGATYEAFLEAVHPEDRERVHRAFQESIASRQPYGIVHRLLRPDGRVAYVQERGETFYDSDGNPVRSVGTVQDISELKEAENALQNSLRLLESVIEHAPTRVFWKDRDSRYLGCNSLFARDAGYEHPHQVVGKTDFEMAWKDQAERYRADDREVISVGMKLGYEEPQTTLAGRSLWLRTSKVPLHGQAGEIVGVLGVYEDITERKRTEQALSESEARLRQTQKLEAIGQLAGGVAHDFNNILAGMMMQLGLLQMDERLDKTTQTSLRELEAQARRAARLTSQLLMFGRRSVLRAEPLELNRVVAELLKMLNRVIGEQVTLQFDPGDSLPLVEADSGMLDQVVMNLVVNARDAMPKGGTITLATSVVEFTEADCQAHSARRPGQFLCLTVSDTGCGMDSSTLSRAFEPFFTTKEVGRGTGLGLATVDGIAAQHHGWVEVESAPGQGSSFRVLLPSLGRKAEVSPPETGREALVRGMGQRVLLVEDDAPVREMVARALRALGYRVDEASNGQAAMKLWQQHPHEINLLLTDMVMPEGITGLELAERLQSLQPDLKVIISSGYSSEIVHAGIPNRPGIVYLPKPYSTKTLAEAVRNCLGTTSGT